MNKNKLYNENCIDTMSRMEDECIDMFITSPPYDNLRDYDGYTFDFDIIANELYRILKVGGVGVWVVGDQTVNGSETLTSFKQAIYFAEIGFKIDTNIYVKQNYRPQNVRRYDNVFEYIFILFKGKSKTFNPKKVAKADITHRNLQSNMNRKKNGEFTQRGSNNTSPYKKATNIFTYSVGRHIGDKIAFSHPAIFPEKLVQDQLLTWSQPNDIIYDPFSGSGTVAKVAKICGRNYLGSEISKEYHEISEKRLNMYL